MATYTPKKLFTGLTVTSQAQEDAINRMTQALISNPDPMTSGRAAVTDPFNKAAQGVFERGQQSQIDYANLRKQLEGSYNSANADVAGQYNPLLKSLQDQASALGAVGNTGIQELQAQQARLNSLNSTLKSSALNSFDMLSRGQQDLSQSSIDALMANKGAAEADIVSNLSLLAQQLAGGGGSGGSGGSGGRSYGRRGRRGGRYSSGYGGYGGGDGGGWDSTQWNEGGNETQTLTNVGLQEAINQLPFLRKYAQSTYNRTMDPVMAVKQLQGVIDRSRSQWNTNVPRFNPRARTPQQRLSNKISVKRQAQNIGNAIRSVSSSALIPFFGGFTGRMGSPAVKQTTKSTVNSRRTQRYSAF